MESNRKRKYECQEVNDKYTNSKTRSLDTDDTLTNVEVKDVDEISPIKIITEENLAKYGMSERGDTTNQIEDEAIDNLLFMKSKDVL